MGKLLLVEDDRLIAGIYQRKFGAEGYQVTTVTDGEAALRSLEAAKPDLVILDIMLSKLNGIQVLKALRGTEELKDVPVIVFSNAYQPKIIDDAWQAGATMVLMKANTSPAKLSETVADLLARRESGGVPESKSAEESAVQIEQRKDFLKGMPGFVERFQELHRAFLAAGDEAGKQGLLNDLHRAARSLTGGAALVGLTMLARMSETYEALLKEMHDKPSAITVSTIRTSTQALGFLKTLIELGDQLPSLSDFEPKVLVVDDEEISQRAALYALERAGLHGMTAEHGETALIRASDHNYDLFILDVDMIGLDGYEVCTRLRQREEYRDTPIIFVTGLFDFQSRAKSSLSGGTDLIAKPYCFVELTVKALTYIFKTRLSKNGLL
jgi:CheY-like chemotaxis protein